MDSVDLAQQAQPLIDGGVAPTLAIGVFDGQTTHRFAHGASADALFEIGSITKVFTGTLLADIAREGLVDLDDPVSRCLPASVRVPEFGDRVITLRHLATHTSGLPRMPDNFAPADPADPYADYTADRLHAFLAGHTLRRAPGELPEYSNLGFMLLGHALAERTGQSYEALLRDRITGPLGLNDTVLPRVPLPPALRARVAKGYNASGNVAPHWTMALPGAGNLLSTVDDLLRFLRANMTAGPSRLAAAMADARALHFTMPAPAPPARGIGLGWVVGPAGMRLHNGGSAGYVSFAGLDADKGHAVAALCGTFSMHLDVLGYNLLRTLDGQAPEAPRVPVPVSIDPDLLAAYAGDYAMPSGAVLAVSARDGGLLVQRNAEEPVRYTPRSETRFFSRLTPVELSFGRGADGQVDHLVVYAQPEVRGDRRR
jgi:CubicO group peptidase (beta-lactamase class C family)